MFLIYGVKLNFSDQQFGYALKHELITSAIFVSFQKAGGYAFKGRWLVLTIDLTVIHNS